MDEITGGVYIILPKLTKNEEKLRKIILEKKIILIEEKIIRSKLKTAQRNQAKIANGRSAKYSVG